MFFLYVEISIRMNFPHKKCYAFFATAYGNQVVIMLLKVQSRHLKTFKDIYGVDKC